jgi:hypothetical protein
MSYAPSARLRGIIHVLRAQKTAVTRHQIAELEQIAKEIDATSRYAPLRLALSALLSSVERTSQGIYRVLDSEVFIWSLDELMKLTAP